MNTFNNHGKTKDYKPIIKLNDGKYLVCFDKVEILYNETTVKNSKIVETGKQLPTGKCTFNSFVTETCDPVKIVDIINEIINERTSYNIVN